MEESSTMAKLSKAAEGVEEQGAQALERVKSVLGDVDQRTRSLAQEHPVLMLLGAASLGYFVGRLIARR